MSSRHTLSYRKWNRRVGSCLAFTYSARWSVRIFSGVARLTPISFSRLVRAHPEPGPLSSPGITRVHRSYGPLRLLLDPSPEGTLLGHPCSQTGLPCCKSTRVRACCAPYPGEQDDRHMSVHQVLLGGLRRWCADLA